MVTPDKTVTLTSDSNPGCSGDSSDIVKSCSAIGRCQRIHQVTPDKVNVVTPDRLNEVTPEKVNVVTPVKLNVITVDKVNVVTSDKLNVVTMECGNTE